jgi:hypothetical protein
VNDHIGWPRAVASGLAILTVGLGVALGGTNLILTNLNSVSRDMRVYLATALFLATVVVVAWVLRRLQARRLI